MKFVIKLILIAVLAFFAEIYLPWWSFAIVCFAVNYGIFTSRGGAFFSGFLAIAAFWFAYAFNIDRETASILTLRISALFSLPDAMSLILVTSLLGGLLGGFASLTGHFLREIFKKKKQLYY